MNITLHGIPNCDSCRKARRWLDDAGKTYRFHDLRSDGLSRPMLDRWLEDTEWKSLLNTRSTTWRQLDEKSKSGLDAARAKNLMLQHPTLVKRPVLECDSGIAVGFSADQFETYLTD